MTTLSIKNILNGDKLLCQYCSWPRYTVIAMSIIKFYANSKANIDIDAKY